MKRRPTSLQLSAINRIRSTSSDALARERQALMGGDTAHAVWLRNEIDAELDSRQTTPPQHGGQEDVAVQVARRVNEMVRRSGLTTK